MATEDMPPWAKLLLSSSNIQFESMQSKLDAQAQAAANTTAELQRKLDAQAQELQRKLDAQAQDAAAQLQHLQSKLDGQTELLKSEFVLAIGLPCVQ
jgi:hypothetical protein